MKCKQFIAWLKSKNACADAVAWAGETGGLAKCWRRCANPSWMLWALERLGLLDARRTQLFSCWCVRHMPLADGRVVWDLLTDQRSRAAVEVAERYAVGDATADDLYAARAAAEAAALAAEAAAWAARAAAEVTAEAAEVTARAAWAAAGAARAAAEVTAEAAAWAARAAAEVTAEAAAWAARAASEAAWAVQCAEIRRAWTLAEVEAALALARGEVQP